MITLPPSYVEQMRRQLGAESAAFLASYDAPRTQGLRLNPLKTGLLEKGLDRLELKSRFGLEPVPWCDTGFYYDEASRPGKHPFHAAGLYYIQEPSAMSAVELLAPEPGDIVLDLAGAPGGKSTHIAGKLRGAGLLVSNEIHPARARILSENIERFGIRNAIVTSASPPQLEERFPRFFDKIMVDAPCSGEGMFRKDPEAMDEWSPDHVTMCAARQSDILDSALAMLKTGGRLAYSTCTFNEKENEKVIAGLLQRYPSLRIERTERIWPHLQRGEGHFVCVLRLEEDPGTGRPALSAAAAKRPEGRPKRGAVRPEEEAIRLYEAFAADTLSPEERALPPGEPVLYGEQLYWLPHAAGCPLDRGWLQGLKVLRPGLHLGEVKKGRLEPAHALALSLPDASYATRVFDLPDESDAAERYLRGEALHTDEAAGGWTLVAVAGFPIGWGKLSGGQLKNHYPKGLRKP
ncbi:RsmB/NOP family class I SAM-dependent RNA methyltransferase [Paenibacillus filicis]|uniref:RsmB/NOP family class I SAM-dependent RNA methyltransferase n=1 Tax=Paenibacillus gyeongsangnamensis TaxID=3388067 RepID=A0ABT4Q5G8_9BACL|nr:RsmB/NOP family class I SAM-dependent RNA methyltransferase [Paenibacillus filicis]MCZ8512118.1 RsmB/NOP family class I SAM-dependent RNA methyltransferase [Paenibacillus filicis]